ncbi:hypothetical protein [Okeania sp. SIO2C9]|nr:hypothetical protein [Okeania sp. SIO2C9]
MNNYLLFGNLFPSLILSTCNTKSGDRNNRYDVCGTFYVTN